MSAQQPPSADRRAFLKGAGVAAVALPVAAISQPSPAQTPPAAAAIAAQNGPVGFQSLSLEEAAFTEALVDHMWPKDELTASGAELGIAAFIDRQLAGADGQGDRHYLQGPFRKGKPKHGDQLPLTPEQYFKAGVAATDAACRMKFSKPFDKLAPAERESFLQDLAAVRVKGGSIQLGTWFNALVCPLFVQGAFADPIYGGNRDKAAWKLIGYPGLPAVYGQDVERYRGRAHPRSATPQSIQDLS